jgi:hypothetical protein
VPEAGCGKVDRRLAVKLAAGRSSFSTRSSSLAAAASPGVAVYGAVATARARVLRLSSSPPPRTRSATGRRNLPRVGAESGEHAPAAVGNRAIAARIGRAAAVGAERRAERAAVCGDANGERGISRESRERRTNWREARGEGFSFLL